ncbi:DUF1631 domain-containing protein [Cognatiluteimonas weifangensis]|uniref:DUF1631 domain-containing protein n=1 Tax=Cognatiluteimonas weifangensis TaxID=2303539 RepID=A0A372DR55_9GAMM|nr:DUF1631 domain-containing protein [Luteimonas weifangensis]RFP61964.1 DUF1631 domain-containing protein [Luteimonas weifangensis]
MSTPPPATDPSAPQTLATATLPRRVRRVLEHLLNTASDELERHLTAMLAEFEQQLFRLADHARNPGVESTHLQTLRTLRLNRSDLVPRFMVGLEASLAALGRGPAQVAGTAGADTAAGTFHHLRLVDDAELDEDAVLRDIAVRQESRASLTLHLLSQRFGVLAGTPAFDAERIPLGPQSLCRILREAAQSLQVTLEARLLLYRIFERRVMAHYPQMLDMLNASVAAEGILPSLTYVPIRVRPSPQSQAEAAAEAAVPGARPRRPPRRGARRGGAQGEAQRTHTAWLGEADAETAGMDERAAYELLQQLLSGRRELIGKLRPDKRRAPREQLDTAEVVDALGRMQGTMSPSGPRNLLDIKQALLAQVRQQRGRGSSFSREDSDTFELLGMLYGQIEREVRSDTPAVGLLRRLQLPLLRVALQDRAFFVQAQHPARQLLNAVAESGARWLDEDDLDPQLLAPLQQAVKHVVEHFDDDPAVFEASNRELQTQLHTLARKAEMAERRHVEAARGKEKLEIAKREAADTIAELVGEQPLPKFVRALLNQAWADVLTLTLLRQGADSAEWRQQLDATRRIVATCGRKTGPADPGLANHIEAALAQVGYHTEEAAAIARRLTSALDEDEDDPASRTELTMKLKARARLGQDTASRHKPAPAPRNAAEQAHYDQLRVMPYGTWIEFVTNQQGDVVRRRLSWYSPITDNALFVNQRGHRVGEQSLDSVARMLARGQARIVTAERGRLVDRAWQATLHALRSFAGHGDKDGPGEGTEATP